MSFATPWIRANLVSMTPYRTSRLPVIYVFGRKSLDVEACVDKLAAYLTLHAMDLDGVETVELRSSVWYSHLMSEWPYFTMVSSHSSGP